MPQFVGETDTDLIYQNEDGSQSLVPKSAMLPNDSSFFHSQPGFLNVPQDTTVTSVPSQQAVPGQAALLNSGPQLSFPGLASSPSLDRDTSLALPASRVSSSQSGFSPSQFSNVQGLIPLSSDKGGKSLPSQSSIDKRATQLNIPFADAYQQQAQGVQQSQQAKANELDVASQGFADQARTLLNEAERDRIAFETVQNKVDETLGQFQAKRKQVNDLETAGIDRSRWWSRQDRYDRAKISVAAFAEGFLKPKYGGNTPPVLNTILKHIDDDVNDQLVNIDLARRGLSDLKEEASMLLNVNQSKMAQRSQIRAVLLDGMVREAEGRLAKAKSQTEVANLTQLLAALQKEQAQTEIALRKTALDEASTIEQLAQGRDRNAISRGQLALQRQSLALDREKFNAAKNASAAVTAIRNPDTGEVIGFLNPEWESDATAKRETQNKVVGYTKLRELSSRYREALDRAGRTFKLTKGLRSQDRAELDSLHMDLLSQIILARSGKAATNEEVERLRQVVPDPMGMLQTNDPVGVLEKYLATEDANIRKELRPFVNIQNEKAMPDLLYRIRDESQAPSDTGRRNVDEELNQFREYRKLVQNPVDRATEEDFKNQVRGLLTLAQEELQYATNDNPAGLRAILIEARKIPPKYRQVTPLDPRLPKGDIVDILTKMEKDNDASLRTGVTPEEQDRFSTYDIGF